MMFTLRQLIYTNKRFSCKSVLCVQVLLQVNHAYENHFKDIYQSQPFQGLRMCSHLVPKKLVLGQQCKIVLYSHTFTPSIQEPFSARRRVYKVMIFYPGMGTACKFWCELILGKKVCSHQCPTRTELGNLAWASSVNTV